MNIRQLSIHDLEKLQEIGKLTFLETFEKDNSPENMKSYLENSFSNERLIAELNNSETAFFFAEEEKCVLGYLKINWGKAQTELQIQNAVEIERIYVKQAFHGKRIGQLLYEKAVEIAQIKQAECIWLGVWEKNERAIRFYEKNGFRVFDRHIFVLGDDQQTDLMMKLAL